MARMTPLKIAAACVAMFTLLAVFARRIPPVPAPAAAAQQRFDAAWQDTVAVIQPMKKADRLTIASIEPKVTERITPPAPDAPVSVPPVVVMQDDDPPAARHRRHPHSESNVCTRHRMKKLITHGGKSWRCR